MAHASIITRKTGTLRHVVLRRDAEHGRKCAADCARTDHQHSAAFATAEQAKTKRTEVDAKLARGEVAAETTETFGAAARRWISTHPGTDGTRGIYLTTLTLHLAGFVDRPLRDVANDRSAATSAVVRHPRGMEMRTVLVKACDAAVNDGKLPGHRLTGIQLPRQGKSRREIIPATHEQLSALADGLGSLGLTVWLMRGCGLRIAEALAVDSSDFRDEYATLRVQRQVQNGQDRPLKARVAGEWREVPVPAGLAAMVKRHVMASGPGRLFTGRETSYVAVMVRWRKLAKAAGLPAQFTPHQCRHAYATALLGQSVPITDVSRWLGHRSFEHLQHVLPPAPRRAGRHAAPWKANGRRSERHNRPDCPHRSRRTTCATPSRRRRLAQACPSLMSPSGWSIKTSIRRSSP